MNLQSARIFFIKFKRDSVFLTNIFRQICKIQSPEILSYQKITAIKTISFLQFSSYPSKCWKCSYPYKSELFCSQCRVLQKLPEDVNYFDMMGLRKDFDVPTEDLKRKYKQLQNLLHPDRFGSKTDQEKEISENTASLVNKAYNTLLHPLSRGLYMLKLHDVYIEEETEMAEKEFLMDIMEKNEQIEEASGDREKTLELLKENRMALISLTKEISQAFQENDIDRAKKSLMRMKYYTSIDERLKMSKQKLGIIE